MAQQRYDYDQLMQLGGQFLAANDFDNAEIAFRAANQLRPDDVVSTFNLASMLDAQGRAEASEELFERANAMHPRESTRLFAMTRQPVVYQSGDELRTWRSRLEERIAKLEASGYRIDAERVPVPTLNIAYQGFDDRDVLERYGRLVSAPSPALHPRRREAAGDQRIRIGIISAFLYKHTIGRITRGLFSQMDREQFHLTALAIGNFNDPVAHFIRQHADAYVEVPRARLSAARQTIAQQQLDVLIYAEIGLEQVTYTLAHSRLAPVQCVTWGHPATSGIPSIDYFLSSELIESVDSQQFYTEKLIKLPNLSVYYYRPSIAGGARPRAAFGLDDQTHVYGCLQTIYKLHPDFDPVLDAILSRDPRGIVLIPRGNSRYWDEALTTRMRRTMPRTFERVRFIDPLPYDDYLQLLTHCDAMLAPIHFGAGNTSYEAFAFGIPTVTLPSDMLKGRITLGMYRAMGISDCIASSAEQYVDIAGRLGADRDFRRSVHEKILASNHVLYENPAGVRDLERFLRDAVAERAR